MILQLLQAYLFQKKDKGDNMDKEELEGIEAAKDLKGCPFCGDKVMYLTEMITYTRENHYLECSNCGLRMWDITKESLFKTWGNRV